MHARIPLCFLLVPAFFLGSALPGASTEVPLYEPFENEIAYGFSGDNPWAEVAVTVTLTAPSGNTISIGGFYYDTDRWRFRFAPDELGVWQWSYVLSDSGSETACGSGEFLCVPSDNPGFVRISAVNPFRFEFSTGAPFHPLGLQDRIGIVDTPINGKKESYILGLAGQTTFEWVLVQRNALYLPGGAHSILFAYREGGTRFDKLLLTTDPKYWPQGADETASDGDDYWIEAESASTQPDFAPWQVIADASASGGAYIAAPEGTDSTGSVPPDGRAEYAFTLAAAGKFHLWARVLGGELTDKTHWVNAQGQWNDFETNYLLVTRQIYLRTHAEEGGFNLWRLNVSNNSFDMWDQIDPAGNVYRVPESKSFDAVATAARGAGMRVYCVLFGFEDTFPYPFDAFDSAKMDAVKRYVKYMVDRYGALVDFWELGNEVDQGNYDEAWLTTIGSYLHAIDPYLRPVSMNWQRPDKSVIDINSPHRYETVPSPSNYDTWIKNDIEGRRAPGKPIVYGEVGNRQPDANYLAANPLKWRVAAWTAFFNEASLVYWNTPTTKSYVWTASNVYMDEEFRKAHRALADFMPWIPASAQRETPTLSPAGLARAYGLDGDSAYGAYVFAYAGPAGVTSGLTLTINPAEPGTARWIDPLTGSQIGNAFSLSAGSQSLSVPDFTADIALLIASPWARIPGYGAWKAGYLLSGSPDADPSLDLDGDGLSNLFEFCFARNPLTPEPLYSRIDVEEDGDDSWLVLELRRRSGPTSPFLQSSTDMDTWTNDVPDGIDVIEEILDADPLGDGTAEDIRLRAKFDSSGRRYFRWSN